MPCRASSLLPLAFFYPQFVENLDSRVERSSNICVKASRVQSMSSGKPSHSILISGYSVVSRISVKQFASWYMLSVCSAAVSSLGEIHLPSISALYSSSRLTWATAIATVQMFSTSYASSHYKSGFDSFEAKLMFCLAAFPWKNKSPYVKLTSCIFFMLLYLWAIRFLFPLLQSFTSPWRSNSAPCVFRFNPYSHQQFRFRSFTSMFRRKVCSAVF